MGRLISALELKHRHVVLAEYGRHNGCQGSLLPTSGKERRSDPYSIALSFNPFTDTAKLAEQSKVVANLKTAVRRLKLYFLTEQQWSGFSHDLGKAFFLLAAIPKQGVCHIWEWCAKKIQYPFYAIYSIPPIAV